jgi:hypothetical protein
MPERSRLILNSLAKISWREGSELVSEEVVTKFAGLSKTKISESSKITGTIIYPKSF